MINWLKWHEYLLDWFTPKFDSVVSAVAGPVIGGIMGGNWIESLRRNLPA